MDAAVDGDALPMKFDELSNFGFDRGEVGGRIGFRVGAGAAALTGGGQLIWCGHGAAFLGCCYQRWILFAWWHVGHVGHFPTLFLFLSLATWGFLLLSQCIDVLYVQVG